MPLPALLSRPLSPPRTLAPRCRRALAGLAATVVEAQGHRATVLLHASGRRLQCQLRHAQRQRDAREGQEHFVIGDRVRVAEPGAAAGRPVALVAARESRTRTMRRRLTAHSQPAIATHVDQLVVVSAVQPPPNRGLLDRFLVLAAAEGIDALLVLNKVDLGGRALAEARETLAPYARVGYRTHELSVERGTGLAELRQLLAPAAGHLSILAGHSGVGKSSLVNSLLPGALLPTDELSVSRRGFRGRHITTRRTCHLLAVGSQEGQASVERRAVCYFDRGAEPSQPDGCTWPTDGAMVVDTAGVRSFGLLGLRPSVLAHGFVEFRELLPHCR